MKKYSIDIESSEGVLLSQETSNRDKAIDVTLPENYVVTDEGIVEQQPIVQEDTSIEPILAKKRQHMGIKAKRITANTIIYIVLITMTIVWLIPFVCIVFESLRSGSNRGPASYIIPHKGEWGFGSYYTLFTFKDHLFLRWFGMTFLMGLVVAVLQMVFVLSVSYALSRTRFKGRKGLMNFMLILGMFPGFLTLLLLFRMLRGSSGGVGLTEQNSALGLILVYVASSGMGYYVSKGYFDTIPRSLDEAARVDGATRAQVLFKVILPMAKPIVIYTVLMAFMAPWGDFILASYLAHGKEKGFNVAVGLQWMIDKESGYYGQYYTAFCAGGVIVAIPITVLFMCLQKYYVEGVTGGAVKG